MVRMFRSRDAGRDFILDHLADDSLRNYFAQPELRSFCTDIGSKVEVVSAKQYHDATGAGLAECKLAVQLAKALLT